MHAGRGGGLPRVREDLLKPLGRRSAQPPAREADKGANGAPAAGPGAEAAASSAGGAGRAPQKGGRPYAARLLPYAQTSAAQTLPAARRPAPPAAGPRPKSQEPAAASRGRAAGSAAGGGLQRGGAKVGAASAHEREKQRQDRAVRKSDFPSLPRKPSGAQPLAPQRKPTTGRGAGSGAGARGAARSGGAGKGAAPAGPGQKMLLRASQGRRSQKAGDTQAARQVITRSVMELSEKLRNGSLHECREALDLRLREVKLHTGILDAAINAVSRAKKGRDLLLLARFFLKRCCYFAAIRTVHGEPSHLNTILLEVQAFLLHDHTSPKWAWHTTDRHLFVTQFQELPIVQQYAAVRNELEALGRHGGKAIRGVDTEVLMKVVGDFMEQLNPEWVAKQRRNIIQSVPGLIDAAAKSVRLAKQDAAATCIQASVRGRRARHQYKELQAEREVQNGAALQIQRRDRGMLARKDVQRKKSHEEENDAAVLIQKRVRGMHARRDFEYKKAYKAPSGDMDEAALKIQTKARQRIARKKVQDLRENHAAVKVQASFRGMQGRKFAGDKREEKKRHEVAVRIQASVRRVLAVAAVGRRRVIFAKETAAATKIQAVARGHQARAQIAAEKDALDEVQAEAVVVIQAFIRGKLAVDEFKRRKAAQLKKLRLEAEKRAAEEEEARRKAMEEEKLRQQLEKKQREEEELRRKQEEEEKRRLEEEEEARRLEERRKREEELSQMKEEAAKLERERMEREDAAKKAAEEEARKKAEAEKRQEEEAKEAAAKLQEEARAREEELQRLKEQADAEKLKAEIAAAEAQASLARKEAEKAQEEELARAAALSSKPEPEVETAEPAALEPEEEEEEVDEYTKLIREAERAMLVREAKAQKAADEDKALKELEELRRNKAREGVQKEDRVTLVRATSVARPDTMERDLSLDTLSSLTKPKEFDLSLGLDDLRQQAEDEVRAAYERANIPYSSTGTDLSLDTTVGISSSRIKVPLSIDTILPDRGISSLSPVAEDVPSKPFADAELMVEHKQLMEDQMRFMEELREAKRVSDEYVDDDNESVVTVATAADLEAETARELEDMDRIRLELAAEKEKLNRAMEEKRQKLLDARKLKGTGVQGEPELQMPSLSFQTMTPDKIKAEEDKLREQLEQEKLRFEEERARLDAQMRASLTAIGSVDISGNRPPRTPQPIVKEEDDEITSRLKFLQTQLDQPKPSFPEASQDTFSLGTSFGMTPVQVPSKASAGPLSAEPSAAKLQFSPVGVAPEDMPTKEEIEDYAVYLGIDLVEDSDLVYIAEWAINAPLPEGWSEHVDEEGHEFYFNTMTNVSTYEHPLDEQYRTYYRQMKEQKYQKV